MPSNFKKVRTFKDIQNDPRVDEFYKEYDTPFSNRYSYWCYLEYGWRSSSSECHTIHERTIKEICDEINNGLEVWEDDPELKNSSNKKIHKSPFGYGQF